FHAADAEVLEFDPSLKPAEDQIIRIGGFALPESISDALNDPISVSPFSFSADTADKIAGLFVGRLAPEPSVLFQVFSRRQVLSSTGWSLILSDDTFRRLEEPGLVLDSRL